MDTKQRIAIRRAIAEAQTNLVEAAAVHGLLSENSVVAEARGFREGLHEGLRLMGFDFEGDGYDNI